jgi:hypothetical protein
VGGRRLRCGPRLWPRRSGPLGPLEPGARPQGGGGGGCARALAAYGGPSSTKTLCVIFANKKMDQSAKMAASAMLRTKKIAACARHTIFASASEKNRKDHT